MSYAPKYVRNCGVAKVGDATLGAMTHKLDHYPFRKMRKSQEQYPFKIQIQHDFHLKVFSMIDIFFLNGGVQRGRPGAGGFFLHITIHYFINVIINIYQQFYCCLHYIFYTQLILLCFDAFFPSPEK